MYTQLPPACPLPEDLEAAAARRIEVQGQALSRYEEDHFISLELGGHPRDLKNLWPEMWGTPATPLTLKGPFPPHLVGAKSKDAVENALHKESVRRGADA